MQAVFICVRYRSNVQRVSCEPLGEHLINCMSVVFSHIARKMNTVCVSHTIKSHMSYIAAETVKRVRYWLILIYVPWSVIYI